MRSRTAVVLCIAGGVLTFAVSMHQSAVDIRLIGVILMLAGVAGLWPRLGGTTWLLLSQSRLRQYADEVAPVHGVRVPLDDLLSVPRRGTLSRANVWAAQVGHDNPVHVLARPPEVISNDEASARATTR